MQDFIEKTIKVKIEFTEPILGAVPRDKEIYTNYIAGQVKQETLREEIERIGEVAAVDKRTCGFLMDEDGNPVLSNHVVKGFFKEAAKSIRRISAKKYESHKMTAYIQKVDTLIHVYPRFIILHTPEPVEECMEEFQRACRASTPQGDRITLKNSERLPEGTTAEFEIQLMDKTHEDAVKEWLDYGRFHGLGEWRNADFGRFEWMQLK